jgi:hypothetical protein
VSLTGNVRVRVTRWSQKLVLQAEHTAQRGILVSIMSDGSQTQSPNIETWWEDCTIGQLQALGGNAKMGAVAKLTVVK